MLNKLQNYIMHGPNGNALMYEELAEGGPTHPEIGSKIE